MYKKRIIDDILDFKLECFGATLIVGPKSCGKTTTAKTKANSFLELQDEDKREGYLLIADQMPSKLLEGPKPRLIDEWQDAPKLWGAVRKSCDDLNTDGLYILTGSSSKKVETAHTGTGRISTLKMYPMSLYETNESNGKVSLIDLFNNPKSFTSCESNLSFDELVFSICRGGWPKAIDKKSDKAKLEIAKDLYRQIVNVDISEIDNIKKNPLLAEKLLHSYSRNICTLVKDSNIISDINSNYDISRTTYIQYKNALEDLFIIDDVDAWNPAIRSKTAIRASKKKNLIDPSLATAALGLSPSYFNSDFKTLGFLFKSLCIRDLKVYLSKNDGKVSYYNDRYGLEADCILHLRDGRYALVEIKLGDNGVEEGAKHLKELETLIVEANNKSSQIKMNLPTLKIVITGSKYGYVRNDGVFVIPIGCLKD